MSTDVIDLIYQWGYNLAMSALNPGWVVDPLHPEALPPVPVIQDQQDESAPLKTLYVAVQGSPQIDPIGSTPYAEGLDATDTRGIVQGYIGTLILWEVNGNGSALQTIRESLALESIQAVLSSQYVTFVDAGTIDDVSYQLDHQWKRQSRMTIQVSIASRVTETLNRVDTIEVDTIESIQYSTNPGA
jgi:hypothetical protein